MMLWFTSIGYLYNGSGIKINEEALELGNCFDQTIAISGQSSLWHADHCVKICVHFPTLKTSMCSSVYLLVDLFTCSLVL